jgi:hypothetical protein
MSKLINVGKTATADEEIGVIGFYHKATYNFNQRSLNQKGCSMVESERRRLQL